MTALASALGSRSARDRPESEYLCLRRRFRRGRLTVSLRTLRRVLGAAAHAPLRPFRPYREAHDCRHPDSSGVGHPPGYHHSPDRKPSEDIEQQQFAPVRGKPSEEWKQPLCGGGGPRRDRQTRSLCTEALAEYPAIIPSRKPTQRLSVH